MVVSDYLLFWWNWEFVVAFTDGQLVSKEWWEANLGMLLVWLDSLVPIQQTKEAARNWLGCLDFLMLRLLDRLLDYGAVRNWHCELLPLMGLLPSSTPGSRVITETQTQRSKWLTSHRNTVMVAVMVNHSEWWSLDFASGKVSSFARAWSSWTKPASRRRSSWVACGARQLVSQTGIGRGCWGPEDDNLKVQVFHCSCPCARNPLFKFSIVHWSVQTRNHFQGASLDMNNGKLEGCAPTQPRIIPKLWVNQNSSEVCVLCTSRSVTYCICLFMWDAWSFCLSGWEVHFSPAILGGIMKPFEFWTGGSRIKRATLATFETPMMADQPPETCH